MGISEQVMEVLEFYADASPQARLADGGKRAESMRQTLESFGDDENDNALGLIEAFALDALNGETPTEERDEEIKRIEQEFAE